MRKQSIADRFWPKVAKSDDCWLWTAAMSYRGYGVFQANSYVKTFAHRVSWELSFGPIPPGLFVCHHCDTPRCVRPNHLFIGTPRDNIRDAMRKGRFKIPRGFAPGHNTPIAPELRCRGEQVGTSKLTRADVIAIRAKRAQGVPLKVIAAEFGVHHRNIYAIAKRRSWKHVP